MPISRFCLLLLAFGGVMEIFGAPDDARFEQLSREFIRTHFAARPLEGVALGWHQYDGQFVVPNKAALEAEVARLKHYDQEFGRLEPDQLSRPLQRDLSLLRSVIVGQLWIFQEQQPASLNPMFYAGALDVSVYLKREFKPLSARVRDIASILRQAPALFKAAHENLAPVLPRAFVETALEVAQGTASFIEQDVAKAVKALSDPAGRADFDTASQQASSELRGFIAWLKEEKLPSANGAFALGADRYRDMLRAELVELPAERILEIGLLELRAEQERFAKAANEIAPGRKPLEVFKAIQREHPTAAGLIPDTRKDLEMIRAFLTEQRLVSIPSTVRPRVEETLPPFRSTSFASMDTPGPFEREATQAYYYVTPVEPDWSPQQADEWLTAFNYYTTDIVSIHEVYPGHYVQFLALNSSSASDIEKTFYSYPFVEGWAHYTEQLMIDQGFGQPTNRTTATPADLSKGAKYRLAQSDEALLRLCRLCCSIQLHTKGMTVDEATRFFVENCYYEEKPARAEALRGTFDPGYLYYTLGKLMILKLRRDWQKQEGAAYSLERFHNEFLQQGAPPIRLTRERMLTGSSAASDPL